MLLSVSQVTSYFPNLMEVQHKIWFGRHKKLKVKKAKQEVDGINISYHLLLTRVGRVQNKTR